MRMGTVMHAMDQERTSKENPQLDLGSCRLL